MIFVKEPVLLTLDRNGAVTHRALKQNTREELEKSLALFTASIKTMRIEGTHSSNTYIF